jgi:hypothetical protein
MATRRFLTQPASRVFWVPVSLFLAALVMVLDPLPFRSPLPAAVPASFQATDISPVRTPIGSPQYEVSVYRYECSDCHRIIPSPGDAFRTLTQHREIELDHGMNTRCFNCHHPTNRDAFVDDFGDEIPWSQPQRVCAKCHGPVYRDWQHGSHGRSNGHWLLTAGPQIRLKCIECHDPHRPPFTALHPAPGPHTLRTDPHAVGPPSETANPLRLDDYLKRPPIPDKEW